MQNKQNTNSNPKKNKKGPVEITSNVFGSWFLRAKPTKAQWDDDLVKLVPKMPATKEIASFSTQNFINQCTVN